MKTLARRIQRTSIMAMASVCLPALLTIYPTAVSAADPLDPTESTLYRLTVYKEAIDGFEETEDGGIFLGLTACNEAGSASMRAAFSEGYADAIFGCTDVY